MAVIRRESGCKVGWVVYDNEAEAREAAPKFVAQAREMAARGYDFGYQSPGEVRQARRYPDPNDYTKFELLDEWVVTTP